MGGEQAVARIPHFLGHIVQLGHGYVNAVGIIAGLVAHPKTFLVRFPLVRPAVAGHQGLGSRGGQGNARPRIPGGSPGQNGQEGQGHLLFQLVDRMALFHVANFVANHRSQLIIAGHKIQKALVHVDKAPRAGQGFDVLGI